MPAHHSQRFLRDLDLAMRVPQVDRSWYENYWLQERKHRDRPAFSLEIFRR